MDERGKVKTHFNCFQNSKLVTQWQYCKYMHLCGTASGTCVPQVLSNNDFLILSFPFLFLLSPSPSNKPTFLYKFVTPFSLVLSVLFLFASEEQQYPGEDPHLKEQYPGEDRNPSANRSSPFLSCPLATPLYPPPNLQNSLYLLGKIKFFFLSLSCGCGVRI